MKHQQTKLLPSQKEAVARWMHEHDGELTSILDRSCRYFGYLFTFIWLSMCLPCNENLKSCFCLT